MVGSDGFLHTIMLAKVAVRGATVPTIMRALTGVDCESPESPPEVHSWMESIRQSSQALETERLNTPGRQKRD